MKVLLPSMALLTMVVACSAENTSSGSEQVATPWCHTNFQTGDVRMALDYQVASYMDTTNDQMVSNGINSWLNVASDHFGPNDQAQAVIVLEQYGLELGPDYASTDKTYTRDMRYENGRFTVDLPNLPIARNEMYSDEPGTGYFWEVAVVVNGVWYKDGDHNFRFIPGRAPGYCASGSPL